VESFAAIFMLLGLVAAVLAKYLTSVRTLRLKESLMETEAEARATRGRLKATENEKGIADRNAKGLERQRSLLDKKLKLCQGELEGLRHE
jgi:hypothetical protein